MPRKREHLSWEEHKDLGTELKDMRGRLVKLSILLSDAYGVSSKVSKKADSAQEAIDKLKCELDSIVCSQFRDRPDKEVKSLYYEPGLEE